VLIIARDERENQKYANCASTSIEGAIKGFSDRDSKKERANWPSLLFSLLRL
jgi:hypothetical protein